MKRIGEIVSAWAQRFLSQSPEEKTWTCQTCGVILPVRFRNGWYARRLCACEKRAQEARQLQQVPKTLAQALSEGQLTQTYTWLGRSWTEAGLAGKTFATFNRTHQPQAFDQARQFAADPQGVLALYGPYGLGKTHLLAAVANARAAAKMPCLFASAVTLFDAIQDRIAHDRQYHDLITKAINTPLLLLDDLDKPKPSEFRQELLYQIIDGRTKTGRPLALSANSTPANLERSVGGAARSRLMMGMIPVPMEGVDYRLGMDK